MHFDSQRGLGVGLGSVLVESNQKNVAITVFMADVSRSTDRPY